MGNAACRQWLRKTSHDLSPQNLHVATNDSPLGKYSPVFTPGLGMCFR